jgi:hypothetical protein
VENQVVKARAMFFLLAFILLPGTGAASNFSEIKGQVNLGGNTLTQTGTIGTSSNNDLIIKTNNTTRMTITNGGSIGVGVTPTEKLDVSGNIKSSGRMISGVSTNSDALTSITANFSISNMIRSTAASAACGTLNVTNTTAGGSFSITILNTTATCTTIQWNGATTNVKLPSGYTGGTAATGLVYSFVDDGATLWVSYVPF